MGQKERERGASIAPPTSTFLPLKSTTFVIDGGRRKAPFNSPLFLLIQATVRTEHFISPQLSLMCGVCCTISCLPSFFSNATIVVVFLIPLIHTFGLSNSRFVRPSWPKPPFLWLRSIIVCRRNSWRKVKPEKFRHKFVGFSYFTPSGV